jgi:RNA polymerase sigma factor (sigma-70 family)
MKRLDVQEYPELWRRFHGRGDLAARRELIELHLSLPALVAARCAFPRKLDVDDALGEGRLALVAAVDSYDPRRGLRFLNWAHRKIRWRYREWLRQEDLLTRGERRRARQEGREADEPILLSLQQVLADLELDSGFNERVPALGDVFGYSPDLDATAEAALQAERLWSAVRHLGGKRSQVLALVYGEDLGQRETARRLGCCATNVSLHRRKSIEELKSRLAGQAEFFGGG